MCPAFWPPDRSALGRLICSRSVALHVRVLVALCQHSGALNGSIRSPYLPASFGLHVSVESEREREREAEIRRARER
eukprot:3932874-Rhodomonas_salina.3